MNAMTEQWIALAAGGVASVILLWALWVLFRLSRPPAAVGDDTERLPKYAEPRHVLLVVAGTHEQYQRYCAEVGLNRFHDAVYVDAAWRVRGWREQKYVMVGTWGDRPDLAEIREALTYQGCTPL